MDDERSHVRTLGARLAQVQKRRGRAGQADRLFIMATGLKDRQQVQVGLDGRDWDLGESPPNWTQGWTRFARVQKICGFDLMHSLDHPGTS